MNIKNHFFKFPSQYSSTKKQMIQFGHVAIIIFLVILILLIMASHPICDKPTENFDTYYNHDMGNHTVYQVNNPKISVDESILKAKYNWSDKNPSGGNVMDTYYENVVRQKNAGYDLGPLELSNIRDYDSKFDNAPVGQGYNFRDMDNPSLVSHFHHPDMHRPGENYRIELSEKEWF